MFPINRFTITTISFLLLGTCTWFAFTHAGLTDWLIHMQKEVNLNGNLQKIGENNARLGVSNRGILQNIQQIDRRSALTEPIHEKLQSVSTGLVTQNQTLTGIKQATSKQVLLGGQLNQVNRALVDKMATINSSTKDQTTEAHHLSGITQDTKKKMNHVLKENQVLEKKLGQAAEKSKAAVNSLP
ncbi:hypothetical protein [Marininema halotolerans]|uniref:Uncharacterized protein n=1 Tax=Marininema halotolerans TaxID=1155944 RepID=A0A1I6UEH6_9BACL|nr:hypothetical protein [Marininema halotolerans]SFS99835.1 hypothetical protein SAMN05444972_1164 [Marininema halotolerans]